MCLILLVNHRLASRAYHSPGLGGGALALGAAARRSQERLEKASIVRRLHIDRGTRRGGVGHRRDVHLRSDRRTARGAKARRHRVPITVLLDDLQLAHAIAHRSVREVVGIEPVRESVARPEDAEALGAGHSGTRALRGSRSLEEGRCPLARAGHGLGRRPSPAPTDSAEAISDFCRDPR